jgi:putative ABC transport system permease protein
VINLTASIWVGALEQGLLYGVMVLGVYITFRVLDFPDLTVDGSFTLGGVLANLKCPKADGIA